MKNLYAVCMVALCSVCLVRADTFYPMIMSISPTAVQVGQTTECEISARYDLGGAYQVFITGDGVTGEVVPPPAAKPGEAPKTPKPMQEKLKVRFKATPDALLGVRDVRLATPQGASTLGQIVVVRDPIIHHLTGHATLKTAFPITLPATVCGAISLPEKVDFYKFTVADGAALTFHMRCHRLQNKIHDLQFTADPILTLRNADGAVLASDDNTFAADPLLVYRFAKAGEYYLEVRDVTYAGNPYWEYSIEINDRPFVTNVYPSRVSPGSTTKLSLIGHNLPDDPTATLTVPPETPEGLHWFMPPLPKNEHSNAVPIIVSKLPEVLEAAGDHATFDKGQPIPIPAGVSGRLDKEGEADCYAFDAKAGELFTFEIVANRHQSELDSVLRILDDKGKKLTENDDFTEYQSPSGSFGTHADSRIENWAAPAAGRYVIEVRDVHQRGGTRFVYFLKATRSQPNFLLTLDTDKTLLAPGTAAVVFARVFRREGFTGEVQLSVEGLPPGVTATCGRILESGTDGCIILQAAADAPREAANIKVRGTTTFVGKDGKLQELTAQGRPLQEYYSPGGGRAHWLVEMHTVSVGDPLDLKAVRVNAKEVTLKPGESKTIEIVIERSPGFNKNVSLSLIMQHLSQVYGSSLPPGVTVDEAASQTLLAGEQTKGVIIIKAAATAKPATKQLVPVLAHVSINFVMKATYAAEPFYVTVTPP
jgi:Bacterial pre-peptidase C-terminal domain